MNNDEFEEQIKLEQLAKDKEKLSQDSVRKDDDGTEYEWDEEKRAWFPKIDEDFIANYQLNYGSSAASGPEIVATDAGGTSGTDAAREYSKEEAERYWRDYYDYYGRFYGSGSTEGDAMTSAPSLDESEERYKDYLEYYRAYYDAAATTQEAEPKKDVAAENTEAATAKEETKKTSVKRKSEPPKWFEADVTESTNVYVSGLPLDVTDEEFSQLMNKCGLVMFDPRSKRPKLKLYRDENGQPKGDGRCCYIKKESVDLALQILDGSELRGKTVKVERAKFELKGEFDPSKCKKKLTNKEKKRMKEKQEKLFDWHPDKLPGSRPSNEKVIILKNIFDPPDFEKNPALIADLRNDIRQECEQYGDIRKVVVFDRHEDGVVMVFYKDADHADTCRTSLNGRWFAKRRVIAATWDGKTKYDVVETEDEKKKRLEAWSSFLEDDGRADGGRGSIAAANSVARSAGEDRASEIVPSVIGSDDASATPQSTQGILLASSTTLPLRESRADKSMEESSKLLQESSTTTVLLQESTTDKSTQESSELLQESSTTLPPRESGTDKCTQESSKILHESSATLPPQESGTDQSPRESDTTQPSQDPSSIG